MDAKEDESSFLAHSGLEQPSDYQIIFKNLTEMVGPCTICGGNGSYPFYELLCECFYILRKCVI